MSSWSREDPHHPPPVDGMRTGERRHGEDTVYSDHVAIMHRWAAGTA